MAKTQRGGQVAKVARRVGGTAGRAVAGARRPVHTVQVTLGDLIAAAFDVAGGTTGAAKLVSSRAMAQAMGKQIVFVG